MRGSIPFNVLFVGEAPGESEDVLGFPFVGPAGKLLDHIIKEIRDAGKRWSSQAVTAHEKDVAGALYYVGIAAALAYHAEKLTSHDDGYVKKALIDLAAAAWLPDSACELLQRGAGAVNT